MAAAGRTRFDRTGASLRRRGGGDTMHRSIIAAVFVLGVGLWADPAASQTTPESGRITGVVVDATTGAALESARVRILEVHREEPGHAGGTFTFTGLPPGTYTLEVDHLGYDRHTERVEVDSGATVNVRVALHVRAIELHEIVITGSITGRAQRDVLSPMSTLRGAELDRRMAGTVASTLEGEPGLSVTGIGPATARPVIRGLGGDRILMLEDGVRSGDMSSTSSDHAVAMDPLTAQQIEVVRGPMSLLYGSSALGGVVNVVRGEIPASLPEHAHGTAAVRGTSVDQGAAGAGVVNFAAGPVALRAEASGRLSGEVDTPAGKLVNTDANNLSLSGGAGLVGSWGHVGASYRYYDNRYGIPGGFVGGHDTGVDVDMRRHAARAQLEAHLPGSRFFSTVRANASFSDYRHDEIEPSGDIGTQFFQDFIAGEVVARHEERGPLAQGAVGVRAQYRDIITGGSLRTPSTYDYAVAAFLIEEIGTGALRLQLGARYDHTWYEPRDTTASIFVGGRRIPVRPRSFGSVSGSVGALYAPSDGVRFGVSVARAFRTPDFNELYSNGPHLAANSFDVGDPSLDAETGLGVDAFVRITSERVQGEIAAFRNQLNDYIFPSSRGRAEIGTQGGRPRFQYTNEDAVFTGAEGDLSVGLTDRLAAELTASYVRARFTSDRAPIPIIEGNDTSFVDASEFPPLIPSLNGRVALRYEGPRFFASAGVRWAAEQDRLGDFESPTDGYATGNLSAGIRLVRGTRLHTVTLVFDNITDVEYRDHLSRIKDIMPQPGRNVTLMYRLAF
jgi:iron complex outermembrane receptor protein